MYCKRLPLFQWLLFSLLASPFVATAQSPTAAQQAACDRHGETLRCPQLVDEFYKTHALLKANPVSQLDSPPGDTNAFAARLAPEAVRRQLATTLKHQAEQAAEAALQTISTTAAVTQSGAAPSGGASTNLVSKPTTTDFISSAAESGAFTDTLNGTALTVQANPLGLTKYLANQPVFARVDRTLADRIQPINFAVTLNIAQSSSSTLATAGVANSVTPASIASVILPSNNASFSSFGVTYNLYRPYNPQDKKFLSNYMQAVAANQSLLNATGSAVATSVNNLFLQDPTVLAQIAQNLGAPLAAWHTAAAAAESAGQPTSFADFVAAYDAYDSAYCKYILARPDAPAAAIALNAALIAFNAAAYTVFNQARGTPLATVGYLYSTPVNQPATHAFTAVVSELFRGGKPILDASGKPTGAQSRTFLSGAQLTANFTAAIYSDVPAGAAYGRLRDLQVSAEFDKPFGGTLTAPRATFSLAGFGQYRDSPTVLNITAGNLVPGTNIPLASDAQVLLGTAGWIGVGQGKLVINLAQGLTLPVALKWSNKTDLLNANDVRGQIGLSYDLSALSKLLQLAQ